MAMSYSSYHFLSLLVCMISHSTNLITKSNPTISFSFPRIQNLQTTVILPYIFMQKKNSFIFRKSKKDVNGWEREGMLGKPKLDKLSRAILLRSIRPRWLSTSFPFPFVPYQEKRNPVSWHKNFSCKRIILSVPCWACMPLQSLLVEVSIPGYKYKRCMSVGARLLLWVWFVDTCFQFSLLVCMHFYQLCASSSICAN